MQKLTTQELVRESFGTPTTTGTYNDRAFDEYHTRRKVSEPTVAGVNFILAAGTLGLLEVWNFPVTVLSYSWSTLVGQTLRFEYAENGDVRCVLINDTPMNLRASLP